MAERRPEEPAILPDLPTLNESAPPEEARPAEPSPLPQSADAEGTEVIRARAAAAADPFVTRASAAELILPEAVPDWPAIPDHEILGVLGRGGMGIVYRARQHGLNRLVALKMILDARFADAEDRARFQSEAGAVARLQHPNIIQVHEVGEAAGKPFFSMEYVQGGSLAQRLNGTPLPGRQAALLLEPLARAMHYAHQQGIIHRDLKPANILLIPPPTGETKDALTLPIGYAEAQTPFGTPKVTDFGLAKQLGGADQQTKTGAVMGTPSYMAPEQASGKIREIGPATDVYALGAILYELLTGRPPFRGESALETLEQVRTQDPVPPSQLQPKVSRDLETICLKCLHKEPAGRYDSAADLARDLRHFLTGEPILARRAGPAERLWRWCRRDPTLAFLLAALVVVFVAGFVGVTWNYFKAEAARDEQARQRDAAVAARDEAQIARANEATQRDRAETALDRAETNLYFGRIAQADLAYRLDQQSKATLNLGLCVPAAGAVDRRGWEWHYLNDVTHADLLTLPGHQTWVWALAFSRDGRRLAVGAGIPNFMQARPDTPGDLKIWDVTSGWLSLDLGGKTLTLRHVSFSPDGRYLVTAQQTESGHSTSVRLWDAVSGKPLHDFPGHDLIVSDVAFSADGGYLVTRTNGGLHVADPGSGRTLSTLPGPRVLAFTFHAGSRQLLTLDQRGKLALWETATGRPVRKVSQILVAQSTYQAGFSPDGRLLATAAMDDGLVRTWDVATGRLLNTLGGEGQGARSFAFSPDSRLLAYAGGTLPLGIFDLRSQRLRQLHGHEVVVQTVAFSPGGDQLATGDWNGTVKVWDLTRHPESLRLFAPIRSGLGGLASMEDLAFDAGNNRVVAAKIPGGEVQTWDAVSGVLRARRNLNVSTQPFFPGRKAAFDAVGKRLAVVSQESESVIKVWEVETGKERAVLRGHHEPVHVLAYSWAGPWLASAAWDHKVRAREERITELKVWHAGGGGVVFQRSWPGEIVTELALSPDGQILAVAGKRYRKADQPGRIETVGFFEIWPVADGSAQQPHFAQTGEFAGLAFSPNGKYVACARGDDRIVLLDPDSGAQLRVLQAAEIPETLAFSPDTRLLAGMTHTHLTLWETSTGQEILSLPLEGANAGAAFNPRLTFSADGRFLAATHPDGSVVVWGAVDKLQRQRAAADRAFAWHLSEASASLNLGHRGAALHHLKQMQEAQPPSPLARGERARLYFRLGQGEQAAADFAAVIRQLPDDPQPWIDRGQFHLKKGKWVQAAADYAEAVSRPTGFDWGTWVEHAALRLYLGDIAGYRQFCQATRARLGSTKNPEYSWYLVWMCGLGPDALTDPAQVVQLAEQAAGRERSALQPGLQVYLGSPYYRAGRFEQASRTLQAALQQPVSEDARIVGCLLLAMTHRRLGQHQTADEWLSRAEKRIAREKLLALAAMLGIPTPDRNMALQQLIWFVLDREARSLGKKSSTP
jgi:WD40 repeat protein/Tfp pilus assembly protein PilF